MSLARANLVSRANAASVLFGVDPLLSRALAHVNASRVDTNTSGLDYCYTSQCPMPDTFGPWKDVSDRPVLG